MNSVTRLLDAIILGIIILCFSINLKEMSILWTVFGFGIIVLEILISTKHTFWRYNVPRWILNTGGIFFITLTIYRINWDNAVKVLLECLICLVAIKWIERRKARDYLQILALCLFALVSRAFFTFEIGYLLAVMSVMVGATASLVILTGLSELERGTSEGAIIEELPSKWLFGFSFGFLAISFPLSLLLFFILPRIETPFLSFLNRGSVGYSGFSETVELGSIEKIQGDNSVAFRVLMENGDKGMPLYWRGIVYDSFDGKSWRSTTIEYSRFRPPVDKSGAYRGDVAIPQTIIMESTGGRVLFCLDIPYNVRGISASMLRVSWEDNAFLINRPMDRRLKYDCLSSPVPEVVELSTTDLLRYTAIPENWESAPAIRNLLRELIGTTERDIEIIKRLVTWLRSPPFEYAASGLPLSEKMALEDFLLKTKRGNCEYFASALTVMLRMAGIPARLVGGYYGGYWHPVASYYLILQKNAHVWVEAFLGERGSGTSGLIVRGRWVRLDPTPAPQNFAGGASVSLWFKIRLMFDAVQYSWHRLIVQYDMREQQKVAKRIAQGVYGLGKTFDFLKGLSLSRVISRADKRMDVVLGVFLIIVFIALGFLFWLGKERFSLEKDHVKLLRRFEEYLGKRYAERHAYETLREWILRVKDLMDGKEYELASEFIDLYERCLYGPRGFNDGDIKQLRLMLSDLKEAIINRERDLRYGGSGVNL
ncbi:MAG: DUF3488 and transglutaminase-like domain-containing protein [Syntrophobacterales bacterium]|nr:DUF3488 and transglutaminase-like domain-containing protein [Syntrophobacterales bacterium]